MRIKKFMDLFTDASQLIRIFDISRNSIILFEGEIDEIPHELNRFFVISIDTMIEDEFDGFLGINIATVNEWDYIDEDENEELE